MDAPEPSTSSILGFMNALRSELTKPTKDPSVSFVGSHRKTNLNFTGRVFSVISP